MLKETDKNETVDVMENINFTSITDKIVDNCDPYKAVIAIRSEAGIKLKVNKGYDLDMAKKTLTMHIKMN